MWTNLADSDVDGINNGPSDLNNLGGFANSNYWSSTESDGLIAWGQYFFGGKHSGYNNYTNFYVRAVRAFLHREAALYVI